MHASPWAHVDHMIGEPDRLFIVLDHDHRIADVAQMKQRVEQALVVALVQADRGFVEDVHHAHQAGADLAGQTNALRFTARQRVGAAIEREIVESDIDQELQPQLYFLDDLGRNLATFAREIESREEL